MLLGRVVVDHLRRRQIGLVAHEQLGDALKLGGGPIDIVQGITEITPTYTKVEGLMSKEPYVCETRIATSSIPGSTLSQILKRQLDMSKPGDRLRIVRLYMQAQRYQDSLVELEAAINQFPGLSNLNDQVKQLRQRLAERLIQEIEFRREAGQQSTSMLG